MGIKVSKKSVADILRANGFIPPRTRMTPISWEAFFKHQRHVWQIDFMSVFDRLGRQLFILGVINVDSRALVSIKATLNPTRNWIIQQICNASVLGFDLPAAVIADNDGIFGKWLERDFKRYFHIEVYRTPYRQPWKNGKIERFFLTLQTEIFNRIDVDDDLQATHICSKYQRCYNGQRPHQAINGQRPACSSDSEPKKFTSGKIRYQKVKEVDGLITRFELAA